MGPKMQMMRDKTMFVPPELAVNDQSSQILPHLATCFLVFQ